MPDKYGFETREDREQRYRHRQHQESSALERRMRKFQELDERVTAVLKAFVAAYELDSRSYDVTKYSDDACWTVGPFGASRDAQLLSVCVGLSHESSEVISIADRLSGTLPDLNAGEKLRAALHRETRLPVL